jgi:RNA polymerase sigma-70 factor, ECF subfamily
VAKGPRNPEDCTDEELLVWLQKGRREVFGELVRRYEREIYGFLRRYLGREEHLAEDVFQNTFFAVFRKIDQYQPGRAAKPWLYTIASNQAIDALRRRNRRKDSRAAPLLPSEGDGVDGIRPLFEILQDHDPGPIAQAELTELRGIVREVVDQLPDTLRQVIILAYFQGLRYQEIAETLDIPLGTVKSRLHAAVAKLCEAWEATGRSFEDVHPEE